MRTFEKERWMMIKPSRRNIAAVLCLMMAFAMAGCRRGPDDATLAANVKAKLAADPTLSTDPIDVQAKDGAVTLTGTVKSEADKAKAATIAQGVEGVKSVTNNLTVRPPVAAAPSISPDTELRRTVSANLAKYGLSGVTVDVNNGEVTLRGDIPRAKLQDAMKAANEAHPKKVNNQLNIK
jgi:osmotically-inducible protein OsmY